MNEDLVTRIICEKLNLRVYTVCSLNTVNEITSIHGTTPNATMALGRTITAAALLGSTLKPESRQGLLVKFSGSGPLKEVHVQIDSNGNIRGYIENPKVDLNTEIDSINFSKAIGAGFLTVIKDLDLKEPYTSIIPLKYGDIAKDIADYLYTSEQVPSALIIALTMGNDYQISSSGGILIQTFPDTDERTIEMIENNINSMDDSLGNSLEAGRDIYSFVSELLGNESLNILNSYQLKASCRCSKKILASLLENISVDELNDMLKKDKCAELTCTFCKNIYNFNEEELKIIIEKKKTKL